MNKLYAKSVSIEITRRCNMACSHCMRGDAENRDIDHKHIRNLLRHFKSIHNFNITGGEPSLNIEAITYILKLVREFKIHVCAFYIVTNGSKSSISKEFIDVCKELYQYQEYKENAMLEISDDKFHDKTNFNTVLKKLSDYEFFGFRGQNENIYLFKEGRSLTGNENKIYPIYLCADHVSGDLYLNAKGEIVSNADLSYERQKDLILCSSGSFLRYIKTTERYKE